MRKGTGGVLVTHPGRQHSHQAAIALERAGRLAGYWAGAPSSSRHSRWLPEAIRRRSIRYDPLPIDERRLRWFPAVPALRRIADALLPGGSALHADFLACRWFDRKVRRRLHRGFADAVIACEISARSTFRRGHKLGMVTMLDAPSLHHSTQDRLHGTLDPPGLHRRIARVKDQEIELADHVVTVSEFARDTYLAAGVAPGRVHAVPLGADLSRFRPLHGLSPTAVDGARFLFAGATIRRKGFDLLLTAFGRVSREAPNAELRVVGPADAASRAAGEALGVTFTGSFSQTALAEEMRRADCLVLPSRNDSFGMVVAEALASGLPVIVSDHVGAKDLVSEGRNGWIVPFEDVDTLTARLLAAARDPARLAAMRAYCRESAAAATWDAYHARFAELIETLVAR